MRHGSTRFALHAPSQPHSEAVSSANTNASADRSFTGQARRGFSLTEALVALVITALVVSLGVAMVNAFATGGRTLPIQGARAASDARVEAMIGELRNAVAISQISPNQVTAVINTAGNASATTTVNGTATGQYAVSYSFGAATGALYRNGGGTARFGAAGGVSPKLPALGGLPTPPTAPSVNPPGPQPQPPSCASPCYNPSGAYVAYTAYAWSGGTAYYTTNSSGASQSGGVGPGEGNGCTMYRNLGTGSGYNQPMGSRSYNLSGNPSSESYLGLQSYYCDWTRNGPTISGGYMAVRNDRYGTLYCTGRGWGYACFTGYVTAIYYVPISSSTAYYYLPSCGCYLSQSGYNADVTNWNNYQAALNTYNQQMAAWQGAKNQWGAYDTSYNAYAGKVKGWNVAAQNAVVNTVMQGGKTGTSTVTQWNTAAVWQLVADNIQSLTFTGYDQNMRPTTGAGEVLVLGIKVQYPGQPIEEEQLTLQGTHAFSAAKTYPLTIPPAPPDPRGPTPWPSYNGWTAGHGLDRGGLGAAASNPGAYGYGELRGPGPFTPSVLGSASVGQAYVGPGVSVTVGFQVGVGGQTFTGHGSGYGPTAGAARMAALDAVDQSAGGRLGKDQGVSPGSAGVGLGSAHDAFGVGSFNP